MKKYSPKSVILVACLCLFFTMETSSFATSAVVNTVRGRVAAAAATFGKNATAPSRHLISTAGRVTSAASVVRKAPAWNSGGVRRASSLPGGNTLGPIPEPPPNFNIINAEAALSEARHSSQATQGKMRHMIGNLEALTKEVRTLEGRVRSMRAAGWPVAHARFSSNTLRALVLKEKELRTLTSEVKALAGTSL